MALLWLAPVSVTLVACAAIWRWVQAIDAETDRLRRELRALPVLASRTRAVQRQADRTAAATDSAADVFGSHLPK